MPLKVAIVHYHLRPGGVTRVIENAVAALSGRGTQVVILTSEEYTGDALPAVPDADSGFLGVRILPSLRYTQPNEKPIASALAFDIKAAAREAFGTPPDIYHLHNHALGKNSAFPDACKTLAMSGASVLFQIHDFAEDGRPANYTILKRHTAALKHLYPQGPQLHYAVLNSRDRRLLLQAGFTGERTHLLPNPVNPPREYKDPAKAKPNDVNAERIFLYPTRAIRRKNIGEMLLWACFGHENDSFHCTLSPQNPQQRPAYERWTGLAEELRMPCRFGTGEGEGAPRFEDLVARAHFLITTSVAEGFGMAYLEPWLYGQKLLGRDLPEITADFKEAGMLLDHLYGRLDLPAELFGADKLRDTLASKLKNYYADYDQPMPGDAVERAWNSIVVNGAADFGRLDEDLQEAAIRAIWASDNLRRTPPLDQACTTRNTLNLVDDNAAVIEDQYSISKYGERLEEIYQAIAAAPAETPGYLPENAVLHQFLDPARFNLLRT